MDQDDKTPKEKQYEGNERFGYGTKERHGEFKGTDVKGVEESIKTENVIKVVDENKDFNDGAIDNKDRDTEEQQIMKRPEKDREICVAVNPSETHAKDVDNSVVSCVNRSLSDDEKEETNITELTDTDLKHAMNGDHGEMESDSKKELDMNSSKDETDDETPGVDGSAALRGEMTESMSARNVNRETSMEDSMKAFSDTYIKVQTNEFGECDERRQKADEKEDFRESQWSIVPEKISLDEDSDRNND